jgi:N-acetylglucosamine kinase-like BadF-type ATPase
MAYRAAIGQERVFDSLGVADCFDLRHRVVPLVARMIDGRAEPTPLLDAVLEHCDVAAASFAEWMLRDSSARARIMRVAPVVFDRWHAGDAAAAALVDRAVSDYVTATIAMARRIGPSTFDACFAGGVITQGGAALIAAIERQLAARCSAGRVTVPAAAPEDGALAIALSTLAPVSA